MESLGVQFESLFWLIDRLLDQFYFLKYQKLSLLLKKWSEQICVILDGVCFLCLLAGHTHINK